MVSCKISSLDSDSRCMLKAVKLFRRNNIEDLWIGLYAGVRRHDLPNESSADTVYIGCEINLSYKAQFCVIQKCNSKVVFQSHIFILESACAPIIFKLSKDIDCITYIIPYAPQFQEALWPPPASSGCLLEYEPYP